MTQRREAALVLRCREERARHSAHPAEPQRGRRRSLRQSHPMTCAACVKSQGRNLASERTLSGGEIFKRAGDFACRLRRRAVGSSRPTLGRPRTRWNVLIGCGGPLTSIFATLSLDQPHKLELMSGLCCLRNQGGGGRDRASAAASGPPAEAPRVLCVHRRRPHVVTPCALAYSTGFLGNVFS